MRKRHPRTVWRPYGVSFFPRPDHHAPPPTLELHLSKTADPPVLRWHADLESRATRSGRLDVRSLTPIAPDADGLTYHWRLPLTLPVGDWHLRSESDEIGQMRLIGVPGHRIYS